MRDDEVSNGLYSRNTLETFMKELLFVLVASIPVIAAARLVLRDLAARYPLQSSEFPDEDQDF
jgi:hypothetical protein